MVPSPCFLPGDGSFPVTGREVAEKGDSSSSGPFLGAGNPSMVITRKARPFSATSLSPGLGLARQALFRR